VAVESTASTTPRSRSTATPRSRSVSTPDGRPAPYPLIRPQVGPQPYPYGGRKQNSETPRQSWCSTSPLTRGRPQGRRIWSTAVPVRLVRHGPGEEYDRRQQKKKEENGFTPSRARSRGSSNLPKPDIVKRMTSNQNETDETKHPIALSQARSIELLNSLARIG
jgi:hypothetical protein